MPENVTGEAVPELPYPPRPGQLDLIHFLRKALAHRQHAIAESGTGTGKTISALTAALPLARANGHRVLYLTRTNSQARQVMREYRALRKTMTNTGIAVALQGRQNLCPLRKEENEMRDADAQELGVMCRDRMKAAEKVHVADREDMADDRMTNVRRGKIKPCGYHLRGLTDGNDDLMHWAAAEAPDAEMLNDRVTAAGQCPYVLTRKLLPMAELVVAPYVYFFAPQLRMALFQWMGVSMQDLVVIVDEAHNLPDFARDLATASLGRRTLQMAAKEAKDFGDARILGDQTITAILTALETSIEEARREHIHPDEEDAILPPDEFDVMLLSRLRTSTPALDKASVLLDEYGTAVRENKRLRGKLPRSYVGAVGAFLMAYRALEPDTHARLVEARDNESRLTAFAVDPTPITSALLETAGSIHLSGTLVPLEAYRDTIGLPRDSPMLRLPSPFPPENRLILVDDEVTTRHEELISDPGMWDALRARLQDVRAATDRNIAVFTPSHEMLRRLAPALEGPGARIEQRGDNQERLMDLVDAFRGARGGTLASVIGGRISEGLDFPEDELEVVIVVGLPYAKPTAKLQALIRFHDRRSGRGWDYAVKGPMVRRVLQAAGRLIRTPTDRGVIILMDRRAAMLRDVLPEMKVTKDPAGATAAFFGRE